MRTNIRISQGFAISAAFESGVSTFWHHDGYRFEMDGKQDPESMGVLTIDDGEAVMSLDKGAEE